MSNFNRQVTSRDQQRRQEQRDRVEQLLFWAAYLPEEDRLLLEQVYQHGQRISEVAKLMKVRPRALQRRVQRLVQRLADKRFRFVARHLDLLPRELRGVAKLRVLEGRSLRSTAARSGLSLHQVRQRLDRLAFIVQHPEAL